MRKMPHSGEKTPIRYADPSYTDPNYARTVEIFDNLSHREIHDGVQLMNPVVLAAGRQAWQGSSTGLATAVEQAHSDIRAAMADGWRGAAADSAADAVREFERQGQQLADVMAAVGQRLGQAGDAAEALRAAVVEPSSQTTDLAGALLDPTKATENTATQKSADGTRQDVVQAMDSIYTNVFISTGSGVPAFPDAVTADVPQPSGTTPAAQVATMPVLDTGTQTLTTPTVSTTAPVPTTPHTTVEPAAVTTQAAAAPTTVTPVSTAVETTPATAKPVVPTADFPASTTPAAATTPTTTPDRPVRPGTAAPVTTAASTSVVAPTVPGTSNTDDERKRDERKRDASGDAINGVGAGAVGGLMGGAMVAGDSPRSGVSTSAAAARAQAREEDEYDEDYHFFDDDLTFLEPADDGGELIGDMDPTTPPVVGEWTELE
ncbi:WXG100 family type VII secretion target [Nocardia sp. NPDC049526]|uniref:WXG100 family type VII secretion target n=1 Tax=Nocardia sp. NPDC049526 TaxID=3364316 RepID=UPI0037AEEC97